MSKIIVELPEDRTAAGSLLLVDGKERIVAGPFPALGRANRQVARSKGNPTADRLRPYGDTPYGTYAVIDIVPTGKGSEFDEENYGSHGAIRLKPLAGEAETAARSGRTGLLIQAGVSALAGSVTPTSGSIRISNSDMETLLQSIAMLVVDELPPTICEVRKSKPGSVLKIVEKDVAENDPPVGMEGGWHLSALLKTRHEESYLAEAFGIGLVASNEPAYSEVHDREVHDREVERERPVDTHDRSPANSARQADTHDRTAVDTHDRSPANSARQADTHDRTAVDTHDRSPAHTAREAQTHDRGPARNVAGERSATAEKADSADTHDRSPARTAAKSVEVRGGSSSEAKSPVDTHDRAPSPKAKAADKARRKPLPE